jgi:hypothetical protein
MSMLSTHFNKFPKGLKPPKPPSQRLLRSSLNVEKTNPVPIQHMQVAKSKGSALKMYPKLAAMKLNK